MCGVTPPKSCRSSATKAPEIKEQLIRLAREAPSIQTAQAAIVSLGCGWFQDQDVGAIADALRASGDRGLGSTRSGFAPNAARRMKRTSTATSPCLWKRSLRERARRARFGGTLRGASQGGFCRKAANGARRAKGRQFGPHDPADRLAVHLRARQRARPSRTGEGARAGLDIARFVHAGTFPGRSRRVDAGADRQNRRTYPAARIASWKTICIGSAR